MNVRPKSRAPVKGLHVEGVDLFCNLCRAIRKIEPSGPSPSKHFPSPDQLACPCRVDDVLDFAIIQFGRSIDRVSRLLTDNTPSAQKLGNSKVLKRPHLICSVRFKPD